jgi:hypothetical protein
VAMLGPSNRARRRSSSSEERQLTVHTFSPIIVLKGSVDVTSCGLRISRLSMLWQTRTTLRKCTALAAVLAFLFATDARLRHLAFCSSPSPTGLSDLRPDCMPAESCCSGVTRTSPATSEACFALGSCDCCSHAPPSHSSEPDARMTSEPVPPKMEIGLGPAPFEMAMSPPALPHSALTLTADSDANASPVLLCNHLRF